MEGLQTALAMRRAACRPPRPLGERLRRHLLGTTAPYGLHNKWPRIFSWRGISQRYLARLRERHLFLIVRKLRRPFDLPEPQERRPRTFSAWTPSTYRVARHHCKRGDIDIDRTIIKGVAVPVAKLAQFLGSCHRLGRLPPNLYWPQGGFPPLTFQVPGCSGQRPLWCPRCARASRCG